MKLKISTIIIIIVIIINETLNLNPKEVEASIPFHRKILDS